MIEYKNKKIYDGISVEYFETTFIFDTGQIVIVIGGGDCEQWSWQWVVGVIVRVVVINEIVVVVTR